MHPCFAFHTPVLQLSRFFFFATRCTRNPFDSETKKTYFCILFRTACLRLGTVCTLGPFLPTGEYADASLKAGSCTNAGTTAWATYSMVRRQCSIGCARRLPRAWSQHTRRWDFALNVCVNLWLAIEMNWTFLISGERYVVRLRAGEVTDLHSVQLNREKSGRNRKRLTFILFQSEQFAQSSSLARKWHFFSARLGAITKDVQNKRSIVFVHWSPVQPLTIHTGFTATLGRMRFLQVMVATRQHF